MTQETEPRILEAVRIVLREQLNPVFTAIEKMTDWPGGQAEALREIASVCSPKIHHLTLRRLTEKIEDALDGKVSGALAEELNPEISGLSASLEDLHASSNALATFLEPYSGFRGTIRLATESKLRPWELVKSIAGKHPFQVRRSELGATYMSAFNTFSEAIPVFILSLESALSRKTGKNFSFCSATTENHE